MVTGWLRKTLGGRFSLVQRAGLEFSGRSAPRLKCDERTEPRVHAPQSSCCRAFLQPLIGCRRTLRREISRRTTATRLNVLCPLSSVVFRTGKVSHDLSPRNGFVEQPLQKGTAPTATRSRAEAFTQLAHSLRLFDPQVVAQLPFRNMKAEANLSVFISHIRSFYLRLATNCDRLPTCAGRLF